MPSKTPSQYKKSLQDLDSNFNVVLNELTNAYPYAKTYPKLPKYTVPLEGDVGNMTKVQSQLFLFLNSLEGDITDVSNSISRIVKQLNKIEKDNKELMIELQSLSDSGAGAIQAYQDSNFVYNYKFYENIVFFLIISGLGYTFYKSTTGGITPN